MAAKFVQIAYGLSTTDNDYVRGLCALDEKGVVWLYDWDGQRWNELSSERRSRRSAK